MMAPYQNTVEPQSKTPAPQPVMKPESQVPPVLQQTTALYQPYQPKKDSQ